jgi:hypothetical protein
MFAQGQGILGRSDALGPPKRKTRLFAASCEATGGFIGASNLYLNNLWFSNRDLDLLIYVLYLCDSTLSALM